MVDLTLPTRFAGFVASVGERSTGQRPARVRAAQRFILATLHGKPTHTTS